jgi:hypothetical protein
VALNPDGTANCDRCGVGLPGMGVLYGMVVTNLDPGDNVVTLIVCYDCRPIVLDGLVTFAGDVCANDSEPLPVRSVATAVLSTDLEPSDPVSARQLAFCRVNGCADILLGRIG